MNHAWFRFYEELNDFLPASRKKKLFMHEFRDNPAVKDIIESFGVPHVEIDLILVNEISVDFTYRINDGDHISVYPVFESLDISCLQHLREKPLRETKFILDVHLGRLSKYLRMLGFDTEYDRFYDDNTIIERSVAEKRIILTRDKILLRNRKVTHGYWVRSTDPLLQIKELIDHFDLKNSFKLFTRCLECNHFLDNISKESVSEKLPSRTRKYYDVFRICKGCGRIYWEGSHFVKMKGFADSLVAKENP
jgi:uncharacterized protein with PIN domain